MGLYPLFWSALEVGRGYFRLGQCEGYIDMEGDEGLMPELFATLWVILSRWKRYGILDALQKRARTRY